MKPPDLLIVTDYHGLCAYFIEPDGSPEIVEHRDFHRDGQTSVPLIQWTPDRNGYIALVKEITAILDRYRPETWAMAAPEPLCQILPSLLSAPHQKALTLCRPMDVSEVDIANVCEVFLGEPA